MLNVSVARRYAEAFFSIAQEQDKVDQYQQELENIVQAIQDTPHLKEYFEHLLIPIEDKKEVAQKIFAETLTLSTLNFFYLLLDKRREGYLVMIYDEYVSMADEARGIRKAEIIAATEVPTEEIEQLAQRLSAISGKSVQLQLKVDPSLLGGVKLRIGDQVIDGTVAKRLQMLEKELKQAKIS